MEIFKGWMNVWNYTNTKLLYSKTCLQGTLQREDNLWSGDILSEQCPIFPLLGNLQRRDMHLWCKDTFYGTYRLPMVEQVGCMTLCLIWSLGAQEVVGSRPGRGNSKKSFSFCQETGKVFSSKMPFYSKF